MCPTGLIGNPTNPGPGPGPGPRPETFRPSPPLPPQPQPQISCAPGTCFRQSMCIPTDSGDFQCAPCPDGYTGDGVHCDDVDEVGTMFCKVYVSLQPGDEISMSLPLIILCFFVFQCVFSPCFPGVRCVNTAPGFHCAQCPLGYTGPELNGVGVAYAKSHKQVKQQK